MKYESRPRWTVDLEVISDRSNLCAAQIEYCVGELCKAIGAPAKVTPLILPTVEGDEDCEADGTHGGLIYITNQHHFHKIELWADEQSDLKAIMQIVADMCTEGCDVGVWDGYENGREDYLTNFRYRLRQHSLSLSQSAF